MKSKLRPKRGPKRKLSRPAAGDIQSDQDIPAWRNDDSTALSLLIGYDMTDKDGRRRHKYPADGGAMERDSMKALSRTVERLLFLPPDPRINRLVLRNLSDALNPDGTSPRRIRFCGRKKDKSDLTADAQIMWHFIEFIEDGKGGTEAAVKSAKEKFGLSRNAVYAALQRMRKRGFDF